MQLLSVSFNELLRSDWDEFSNESSYIKTSLNLHNYFLYNGRKIDSSELLMLCTHSSVPYAPVLRYFFSFLGLKSPLGKSFKCSCNSLLNYVHLNTRTHFFLNCFITTLTLLYIFCIDISINYRSPFFFLVLGRGPDAKNADWSSLQSWSASFLKKEL